MRDLLIIGGVLVALFALSAAFGVFEHLSDWLLTREQRGGVFALLTLLAVGAAVFSALRWRQAAVETRKRIEAERRYRLLVEQAPVVIYAWDPVRPTGEASALFVSPQIEALLGYSADEWMADPGLWIERIHPDDRDEVVAGSEEADRTGGGFHMEYRALHRDGRILWIHDESRPVTWREDGTPALVQGVMVDITRTKSAEEQQRETQRRFQALVERLPAVTYVEDAVTGRYRYLSPQIGVLSGYPVERWIDDPDLWAKALHPDDRERVLAENEADTGDSWSVDYRMLRADGRTVWVHNESVLIRDEDGRPLEWVGVCTDLTEQKDASDQVRAAEERFRAIVEHIPAAVYLDLPDGSMESVYVSPQVETVMGVTVEHYIAEPDLWLQLMDDEDRRRCERSYLEAVESGTSWEDEYRIRKPDGKLAWIHDETTFITDPDGAPLFLLGVLYDVTPRKRAEETLRESERREHAAAERLRTLDDMKNTFLAAVSHELRSPLTSILGLSLTLERTTGLAEEDRHDLVVRLSANAQKLDRLLKDLLDLDRLNRGIVEPQRRTCDVGALARGTLATLETLSERHVVVSTDDVELEVDAAKVERIVENLLTNAVRHTPIDGTIWLRVEGRPDGVTIAVEDDGPGVADELRTTIFEPFRQGPAAPSHSPGTGIGLSLVARFAELHGGRAWVEDRPAGGASFRVFLPRPGSAGIPALASVESGDAG
ncbi:MAG TPA: PAS domain-containing protein [Actinomycetota bacterium]|nr:PAS domain-containing protein [Actinomycetota bacterium]